MTKLNGPSELEDIRHSLAHLLAAAVMELWPDAKRTIGPAIENGFYFDFEFKKPISDADLPKIENKMREILPTWDKFSKHLLTAKEAKKEYPGNRFKHELIDEFSEKGKKKVSFYKSGDYWDLCRGGHAESMHNVDPQSFKLDKIAGAYWRGDEKNPMLTRIYGLAFRSKKELDQYLWQREETKKRDHRKLGRELDFFSFHEEGPGFAFWHPKGMVIRDALMTLYNKLHRDAGYQQVSTPVILSEDLWRRSGHWDHYKDNMYFTKIDKRNFAIKPMNCPGVILIYKNQPRSYKDLPLRFAEAGEVHRHEPSGTLYGLFRVRAFRQDDAHLFVLESQIEEEVRNIISLTMDFYKVIGFANVRIELSTRPENSIGSDEIWEKAESILKKILKDLRLEYQLNEGDGAFYGPKIDFHIKDVIGRSWQCGTIQLDFFMPDRFNLEYIARDGSTKRPVMIHRTVLGSIQRFMGILIEHYGGAFPVWLAPVQAKILPVSEKFAKYAAKVAEEMKNEDIRVEVADTDETLGKRIRAAEIDKIPYTLVVGEKEEKNGTVNVRHYRRGQEGEKKTAELVSQLRREIESRTVV